MNQPKTDGLPNTWSDLEYHPIAECWPQLVGPDFDALVLSIRTQGLISPITIYEGLILDGRNRHRACVAANIKPHFATYEGSDPIGFCQASNDTRRHLNESQRAMVAARLAQLPNGVNVAAAASIGAPAVTQTDAADRLKVARAQVQRARVVQKQAVPAMIAAVDQGLLAVSTAATLVDLPESEQEAIAAKIVDGGLSAPAAIREVRRESLVAHLDSVSTREAKAISGTYDVVVIDPPWPIQKIELDVRPTHTDLPYPTMTLDEIGDLHVPAADDCHVFLWTTQKHLPDAFGLLAKWGLRYVMTFVWHKANGYQPLGLPKYNAEFCLYARKGTPEFVDTRNFWACFEAPTEGHSIKPEFFYDVVRRVCAGRRIDMFGRREIEGFDSWGKEAPESAADVSADVAAEHVDAMGLQS